MSNSCVGPSNVLALTFLRSKFGKVAVVAYANGSIVLIREHDQMFHHVLTLQPIHVPIHSLHNLNSKERYVNDCPVT